MVKFVQSKWLGIPIRSDDWEELGIPTQLRIKEAIEAGRTQEAVELVDYLDVETYPLTLAVNTWLGYLFNHIADNFGEEKLYEVLKETGRLLRKSEFELRARIPTEEYVRALAQGMHVEEYPDRYVLVHDPCRYVKVLDSSGSGGVIKKKWKPHLLDIPGKTKRAYPWSWSKANVPYYCAHCCVWGEIVPIEMIGYPLRVCLFDEDPEKSCFWVYYKRPELIPEEYFTRIGKVKDPSKFK